MLTSLPMDTCTLKYIRKVSYTCKGLCGFVPSIVDTPLQVWTIEREKLGDFDTQWIKWDGTKSWGTPPSKVSGWGSNNGASRGATALFVTSNQVFSWNTDNSTACHCVSHVVCFVVLTQWATQSKSTWGDTASGSFLSLSQPTGGTDLQWRLNLRSWLICWLMSSVTLWRNFFLFGFAIPSWGRGGFMTILHEHTLDWQSYNYIATYTPSVSFLCSVFKFLGSVLI